MTDTQPQDPELKFAIELARLADQTRCHNVILLDVRRKSPVTKFFLIATGTSDRQRRTVGDELIGHGKNNGFPAWRSNGYETAKWIVVDFVDVVAHIFEEASRTFYDLEMLWGDCPRVQWQLPQSVVPAAAQPASSMPPEEPTIDVDQAIKAPDAMINVPKEPEVEEFVDEEILFTQTGDGDENVEAQEVELLAVAPVKTRRPKPRKVRARAGAQMARKSAKPVKVKAKTKTKAKTKAASRIGTAAPVKPARTKASAGKVSKPSVMKLKSGHAVAGRRTVKKVAVGKSAVKKQPVKAASEIARRTKVKTIKRSAVKAKKR